MKKLTLLLAVLLVLVGAGIGYSIHAWTDSNAHSKEEASIKRYPFLAKRILVDSPNDPLLDFVPLRTNLSKLISSYGGNHSVYFEYLPTGTSFGVGDSQSLVAASLIKLPFVMDLYRASELKMIDLDATVTLGAEDLNSQYGELYKRGEGAKITLREAAKYALTQSDNTAILVIQRAIKDKLDPEDTAIAAVDADFSTEGDTVLMNARSYSSILKCLYFACYVDKASSNEILKLLSQSIFNDRISAPIPKEIPVAHKIGVNYNVLNQSDCGIFFVPKRPYVLCVMLEGSEADALPVMRSISEMVYRAVTR